MKKIFFLLLILSTNLFAQSEQDQFNNQVEAIMKMRAEMLKSLMDDSSMSGEFEKRVMEMMKNFDTDDFGVDQMDTSLVVGEYDWIVSDTQKILKLKVKQIKDHPLDIKIEKGTIKIKGDVESSQGNGKNKSVKKVSFERSFTLPDDVDQTNPEFENKGGELLIKFKRLGALKDPNKIKKKSGLQAPEKKEQMIPDRIPVAPSEDDLSI